MLGLQLGVPLVSTLVAAGLYAIGTRRGPRPVGGLSAAARRTRHERAAMFGAALVVVVIALASPVDTLAEKLFWVHMTQHLLLMMVAAPLLVLSAPWMALWRPFPLRVRRRVARFTTSSGWFAPFRAFTRPVPAFVGFNVVMWVWHAPYLYDLTLRSQLVHDTEHFLFLASGVLLWAQLADSPPLHARLGDIGRGALAFATIFSSWVLALVFVYWPSPLYSAYASLPSRPGGISALTDQQLAAGMMLVPGSLPLSIAVFVFIYRLLADDRGPGAPRRRRFSAPRLEQKGV